ncbi:unnamed protein product, partial [Staurois parvus]
QTRGRHSEGLQTDIPVPKFKRERNESVGAFLSRMNRETQHVLFLTKNQLERRPEMDLDEKKQKSEKRKQFDRKCLDKFVRRREEKKEARLEKEIFKDEVMFGEVALEPPSLTVKPRKGAAGTKPREKQLFLKKLLAKASAPSIPPPMSMARKRMVEEERERVINAYREMKKRKQQQAAKPSRSLPTHEGPSLVLCGQLRRGLWELWLLIGCYELYWGTSECD